LFGRSGQGVMDLDAPRLFLKGLRWSYRRYGVKGALGFLLLGVLAYVLFERTVRPMIEGQDESNGTDAGT
jgi:hypothetical protein